MNTENVKLFSKTLGGDVDLIFYNGNVMHHCLKELVMELAIKLEYKVIANSLNPVNHLIQCTASLGDYCTVQFGESNSQNLDTDISRAYPALTAIKRAHDRAVIALLRFEKPVYSCEEMPNGAIGTLSQMNMETQATAPKEETKTEKKKKGKVADTKKNKADAAETIVPSVPESVPVPGLEPEKVKESGLGKTVIPFGNFKGKTFDDVYAKGGMVWFDWVTAKFMPTSGEEEHIVELCRQYTAEKTSAESVTSEPSAPEAFAPHEVVSESAAPETVSENTSEIKNTTEITDNSTEASEPVKEAETVSEPSEKAADSKMSLEELEKVVLDIGICKGRGATMKQIYSQSNGLKWMNFIVNSNKDYTDAEKEQISLIRDYLSYVS